MINFQPIKIEDKELITSYLFPEQNRDCNLSFVNLCSWQFLTYSSFAIVEDCLVIRFSLDEERVVYLMSMGKGDIKAVIELLRVQAKEEGHTLRLHGVFPKMEEWLNREFPGRFKYVLDRDYFDYIYFRKDLVELKGKYLQPKRNHVNKFKRMYKNYKYTPLTPDLVPRCLELEEKWCEKHDCSEFESLENERKALTFALQHFDELDLMGGALWVEDEIVAFTYGVPVTYDTFGVHIEKADTRIEGVYPMINREFASHIPEQYIYLNREEDMGLPGLRKAKLSYHPVMLLEKGFAEMKED